MVAFAVGGLLGDTIFHLLPEIFLGEASPEEARFVLVAPNKNLLLGVAILVGFMTFVAMDKGLRIASGGESGHDHSHGQKKGSPKDEKAIATSALASGASPGRPDQALKPRKSTSKNTTTSTAEIPTVSHELLQKIITFTEPERSKQWLRAVVEADADSNITQLKLWNAYQKQLKAPYLPAADFIKNMSTTFNGAEAQTVTTADKDGTSSKYIIKGVQPRSSALTLREHNVGVIKRKIRSPPQESPPAPENNSQQPASPASPSIRLSAYLNLIADFTHNITDGLALSSSFYASPTLGATTTVAVFFHEIPHEVGDFALLIQSGFSKRRALGAQFVTALGAFLGTFLGIAVQELGKRGRDGDAGMGEVGGKNLGLAGTGLGWGDLLLPFTAGTFLYVGTVAVIPELLESGADKSAEMRKTAKQFAAMTLGAGIMLA